ncbi:T9SS type A sorting domain-containing protein, partial [Rubrivirga sp.]|uniref:T9SS type A sorting domain-containing protein n=1 Tax=Rubrivirga sp. TaxID=1885344 RepID=UPI003C7410BB
RSMVFFYNGDDVDDGRDGYGDRPPALGIDILSGAAVGRRAPKAGAPGRLQDGEDAYLMMRGLWTDGLPLRLGADGYHTDGPVTTWGYSGDPPEFWSEYDADGQGTPNTPGDRQAMVSSVPFRMEPGERKTIDIGYLFAQGADNLDSVRELGAVSDVAQGAYETGSLFAPRDAPPPPSSAPALLSPADGASFADTSVTFSWSPVATATSYRLELATGESFEDARAFDTDATTFTVPRDSFPNNTNAPTFWRVRAATLEVEGPSSEVRSLTNVVFFGRVTLIEVVANAGGPIVPPTGGAADFAGFPVPERPDSRQQATTDAVWFLSAGGGDGSFDSFLRRSILDRGGNVDRLDGSDYEIRFTSPSTAYRRLQDGGLMEIPFEIWNIGSGTPDDVADDYQMIPAVLDVDDDGTYNLSTLDSPVSSADNDPETDWVYWHDPLDTSPGDAGYQAWLANAAAAPANHGGEVLGRTTFVGWNLGSEPPYAAPYPEEGTVFRITTLKRFNVAGEDTPSRTLALAVYPNPASSRAEVAFVLPAAGPVRLAVYDVLGRQVTVLEDGPRAAGEHRAALEVERLAPGVYVVVLEGADERASRTITVVR